MNNFWEVHFISMLVTWKFSKSHSGLYSMHFFNWWVHQRRASQFNVSLEAFDNKTINICILQTLVKVSEKNCSIIALAVSSYQTCNVTVSSYQTCNCFIPKFVIWTCLSSWLFLKLNHCLSEPVIIFEGLRAKRAYIEFWSIFIFCRIELIFGRLTCFGLKSVVP